MTIFQKLPFFLFFARVQSQQVQVEGLGVAGKAAVTRCCEFWRFGPVRGQKGIFKKSLKTFRRSYEQHLHQLSAL